MKQMLDWAVDAEFIPTNYFRQVKLNKKAMFIPKKKKACETQVFTEQEIQTICDYAYRDFKHERCTVHKLTPLAIMFMFHTGLRIGELLALRYEDINGDELTVQRMYCYETKEVINHTKGYRNERTVYLIGKAVDIINEARNYQKEHEMDTNGYIFSVNEKPLSYHSIKKLFRKYCEEMGTVNKSSHKARKTFITKLHEGGVTLDTICSMVGHNDKSTTYNHYLFERNGKQDILKQMENALK